MGRGAWQAIVHGVARELDLTQPLNIKDIVEQRRIPFSIREEEREKDLGYCLLTFNEVCYNCLMGMSLYSGKDSHSAVHGETYWSCILEQTGWNRGRCTGGRYKYTQGFWFSGSVSLQACETSQLPALNILRIAFKQHWVLFSKLVQQNKRRVSEGIQVGQ